MKYFALILILFASTQIKSQDLYPADEVLKIELNFYNSNYKQFLEQYREQEIELPAQLILNDSLILDSVGVRYKGNSSYNIQGDKKSFNISIDAFKSDQELLGCKTLNLNNGFVDPTMMRENIVHRIYKKYLPALKTGYVYLFINGEEYGLYSNVQQLNKNFLGDWYDYKTGNLYKGDPRGELSWKGAAPDLYKPDYEKKTNEAVDDWSDLIDLINTINNSKNLESDLPKLLNTDRVLWYFALSNIFVNLDSYIFSSHNYYIYNNPSTNIFDFLPWDLNESFGTFPPDLPFKKEEYPTIDLKAPNRTPLLKNMLSINSFKQKYFAHYRTLLNEYFQYDSIYNIIETIRPVIDSYVQQDPKKLYSYSDFNKNITEDVIVSGRTVLGILNFVNKRRAYLLNQTDFKKTSPVIKDVKCISDSIFAGSDAIFNVEMKSSGNKKVELYYRIGKGVFQSVEMFDDGLHNDSKSFDNIYGTSINIPEKNKENKIDFYATATNNDDVIKFYPERAEFEYLSKEITIIPFAHSIVINELMASNKTTISDENGGFADWIEIHNKYRFIISLNGWFITDDINKKTKWKFPNIVINPFGYIILWADEDEEQGELHTNFKLSANGEYLGLYDADTNLIDFVNFDEQSEDISYGRYPDGSGDFIPMDIPTPGSKNMIDLSADTLPPIPVWSMDCCGNVNHSFEINLWDMPQDSNRSNLSTIVSTTDNYELTRKDFKSCMDSTNSWSLITKDCKMDASARLTFYDCAGNDTTIFINYYAPDISFSTDTIDFGICKTETVIDKQIVLKNNSDKSEPVIFGMSYKVNSEVFTLLDTNSNPLQFPFMINKLDSITLIVRFASTEIGNFTDTIFVLDTCLNIIADAYLNATTEGLGVDENSSSDDITMLPNPASDILMVSSNSKISDIRIFNVLGSEIKCPVSANENRYNVITSNLYDGMYILKVRTNSGIITKQFLISR